VTLLDPDRTQPPPVCPTAPGAAPGTALGQVPAGPGARPTSSVNLPNALTLGRLLVVPVFATVLLTTALDSVALRLLAFALFAGACLTDVIDGRLARARGQVTAFGVMADPVADKALVAAALVGLSLLDLLEWWATVLILTRELAVTVLRTALLRHGLLPASRGGKLKCLTQNIAVALYLLPLDGGWAQLREPALLIAVAFTLVSGVDYALRGAELRRSGRNVTAVRSG